MKRSVGVLVLVLAGMLAFPSQAFAGGPEQGQVVFGGSFTLESGQILEGDLVIFGGSADLEEGSLVEGNLFLMGGNAVIDGQVNGDLVLLGGNVDLGPKASIGGDVVTLGGNLDRAPGSTIAGDVVAGDEFSFPFSFNFPSTTRVVPLNEFRFRFSPVLDVLWFGLRSLLVAALATIVVMFWPEPTARAARAVVAQPLLSGGLGLLTFVVAPVLLIVLAITIILSPVSLLAAVLLVLGGVFGWIAIGKEVGDRLVKAFTWDLHPAASAGLGTLALSLVVGGIGLIPCVGWMVGFVVVAIALGAVLLTRFGSREYAPAPAATPPPAPVAIAPAAPRKRAPKKRAAKKTSSK